MDENCITLRSLQSMQSIISYVRREMKIQRKELLTFVPLLALTLSTSANGQQQKHHKVWDEKSEPLVNLETDWRIDTIDGNPFLLHYADGGSLGIVFKKGDEEVTLILDRSSRSITIKGTDEFQDIQKFEERNDGLLYLGEDNFKKRIPANVRSQLFLKMEILLKECSEQHDSTETAELKLFLVAAEMMRSNRVARVINSPDPHNGKPPSAELDVG